MEQGAIVRLLKSHGAEVTLGIAALLGDVGEVQRLLDAGAAVNGKDHHGWTPLMNASQRGHVAAMRLLLKRGANVRGTPQGWLNGPHGCDRECFCGSS